MNRNFRNRFLAILLLMLLSAVTFAQNAKTVTGSVTDKNGVALPGTNVVVQGTTTGVQADMNGNFQIPVENTANTVLEFSFIGYIGQKIALAGQTSVKVVLIEEAIGLNEVVVIGYGTVKKKDLTGSVGTASSDVLTAKGTSSAMGALQGSIPGVSILSTSARPGGSYTIKIRGQNTMNTSSDIGPLYVVDGVVTSDIDFLNPADIDRIDILKDASSTAIYGSRGSNGVVLVQTKNAGTVKGAKIQVSYDGYYGVRKLARLPEFMDGREWIDFRTQAFYSWNATTKTYELTTANQNVILLGSPVINQRLYEQDYEDWLGLATRNGSQQNHYLNIAGTTNNISYNIGMGYQNEEGNFINEKLDRYNVKISVTHKASKYFMSGATANISQTTTNSGSQYGYRDVTKLPNILHAYDDSGNLIPQPGIAAVLGGTGNFTSTANPIIEIESGDQETRRYDIVANVFAQLTPIEGLDIKSTLSPRYNRTRAGKYYGVVTGNRSVDYASTANTESFDFTLDNQISYNKTFDSHHLNATFINSIYKTRYEGVTYAAQNFPYNSGWYNIFSGTAVPGDCSSSFYEVNMLSYAGRVNYDFKGKYFGTATIRYDGSSKLANKWAAFPSFALAWRASEESFLKNDWLSNLKARFSFGYSGNNNGVAAYGTQLTPITKTNVLYDFNGTLASGFNPGDPVNRNLTWEKTRELNLGIDYGFYKDRITGSIDVYDKLSDGLLMARSLPLEVGVATMTDNIGSVSNKGIEFSLNTVNIRTNDFSWSTSLSFAYNKNEIVSLYGKKEDVVGEARFIGKPINVIYDYKILGVWTQAEYDAGESIYYNPDGTVNYTAKPGEAKTKDVSGNGTLGSEDKVILGSPDPKWTGSFSSSIEFRNFDFSFNIFTNQGVYLFDYFTDTYGYNTQRGMAKVKLDYYVPANVPVIDWNNFAVDGDGNATATWTTSGEGHENAKYPIYKNSNGAYYGNNGNYQDASFIKVKNITFGYTFKENLSKKIGLSKLRLYVNVLNPFTFTNYVGWDPEYAGITLQNGNGPSSITYQFGINAKF
jgi:TonB-linked SusC/RagA family outer membrane protein